MATQTDGDPLVEALNNLLQEKLGLETLLDEAQDQVRNYERSNDDLRRCCATSTTTARGRSSKQPSRRFTSLHLGRRGTPTINA
jgi:hypothetical protein